MRWGWRLVLYWCNSQSSRRLCLRCERHFKWFVCVPLSFAAKHHCLSQPGGPQWLPLPSGGHGGTSVHAAVGEGGTNGRHSGTQRPARGAAWRGPLFILFFMSLYLCLSSLCLSTCLSSGISPFCFSLPGSTTLAVACWFFLLLPFPFSTPFCYDWLLNGLWPWQEIMDQSTFVQKMRKMVAPLCCLLARLSLIPFKLI